MTASPFKSVLVVGDDWAHAAKACADLLCPLPERTTFGFLYVTDALAADLPSILTYLRQKTAIEHWVGTVGIGVHAAGTEVFDQPAIAAMTAPLPPDSFHLFASISQEGGQLPAASQSWIVERTPGFGIVHADPTNGESPVIVETLGEDIGAFLVGGLTSSREAQYSVAGALTGGGVSGVLFAPSVPVMTGLTQGCQPLAQAHVISDCLDNVVIGLDGRSALEALKEDVGELLARDLARIAGYVHAALPIEGSDTGDYTVRSLIAIDPTRGWLALGGPVEAGERLLFVRRDPRAARADLQAMLRRLRDRLPGPPRGGLYVSCLARGPNMFGDPGVETGLINEVLGDFPLVGFFANGEFSGNRLYSFTGVLTLFL